MNGFKLGLVQLALLCNGQMAMAQGSVNDVSLTTLKLNFDNKFAIELNSIFPEVSSKDEEPIFG